MLVLGLGSASRNELVRQSEDHPYIKVMGQATHRRRAIRLLQQLISDLLILMLDASSADNVEIVETITATSTAPILVMRFCPENRWDGGYISRGVLTVLHHSSDSPLSTSTLRRKMELLVDVKVIRHIKGLRYPNEPVIPAMRLITDVAKAPQGWPLTPAIVCSAGRPQAPSKLLQDLSGTFPCPVPITQYIADDFTKNMVRQLDSTTNLKVQLTQKDGRVEAGYVYILSPERHLIIRDNQRLATISRQKGDVHHPSCDLLLESVIEVFCEEAVGLIMTGMGGDDYHGIELIARHGGTTLVQDGESPVMFDMNRSAIDRQLIHRAIPLDGLITVLLSMACHGHIEGKLL